MSKSLLKYQAKELLSLELVTIKGGRAAMDMALDCSSCQTCSHSCSSCKKKS